MQRSLGSTALSSGLPCVLGSHQEATLSTKLLGACWGHPFCPGMLEHE